MTPLDVAVKRGHVKVEEFLRGAVMSDVHVSTHETVLWQSWIEIEQHSVVCFGHTTVVLEVV